MNSDQIAGLALRPDGNGWTTTLASDTAQLYGKEVQLRIDTRLVRDDPETLPPVSPTQGNLVRRVLPALSNLLTRVESALEAYHKDFEPEFRDYLRNPHVWLDCEVDDGFSWTFVVERTDNPDFGYHAEFRGTQFVELWAGD
jgi:hypothetical protein